MVDLLWPYVFFLGLLAGILSGLLSRRFLVIFDHSGVLFDLFAFILWSFIFAGFVCVAAVILA